MASDEDLLHRVGGYVAENRRGMLGDLVFAVAWVTFVDVFFRFVDGPAWAYYTFMLAGVVAYFGFVLSAQAAMAAEE